jgi:predicted amidohydrolase YtcJ
MPNRLIRGALVGVLLPALSVLPARLASQAAPAAAQPARAELIITGARIYTADENRPMAEAMAVAGGRILFVGSERGAMTLRGPSTTVVNAEGQTVIPGMIDAHVHLLNLGNTLRNVDLVGTKSYDEVIAKVVERARTTPAGGWIIGRGWDQNDWGSDTRFPTHEALTRAVPNHPVVLTRIDGHATLVNEMAMRAANLTAATTDPSGGRIERGAGNAPTGVLVDRAMGLVNAKIPPATRAQTRDAILAAIEETSKWGLTGVHDAGVAKPVIDIYESLAREGRYNLRNYVMIAAGDSTTLNHYLRLGPQSGLHNNRIWIRAIKISSDGALGSRGAAMLEPYSDDPGNSGLLLVDPAFIESVGKRALTRGFQLNVHAIGDRGNRVTLDAFEKALTAVPRADHRFRVEHAQIINPADIPRFAKLDVIPSMQAVHQTSDMYWAGTRVGEARLNGAYAWRTLLNTGVIIPNGSDFPVEATNPLFSFHSAVSRQDEKNFPEGGWRPQEKMTRDEALKSITIWPAFASFMEKSVGSLEAGKLADFVILDRDIMKVPDSEILGTRVIATYLGGKPIYRRAETRMDSSGRP